MTDIDERRSRLRNIRNIVQKREVNAATNKEIILGVIAIFCIFTGIFIFNYSFWGGISYFLCFLVGYCYKALLQVKHRSAYWNSELDRVLKAYQPLDRRVWADFKTQVSAEGMTYEACDVWMKAELTALFKKSEPEWSFINSTPGEGNDYSN